MKEMKKTSLVCAAAAAITLSGCANMSEKQQGATIGAGSGALLGALVGGLTGDWQGALIGAGAGALLGGAAGYMLAPDPLTQSTAQTGNEWQQNFSAKKDTRMTPVVLANGQKAQQIDEMRLTVPSKKMVAHGRLSPDGQTAIRKLIANAQETGGVVAISYPPNAPALVVQELLETGATLKKGGEGDDYVFMIARNA